MILITTQRIWEDSNSRTLQCSGRDFMVLERLTNHAESEKTNLQSIALPENEKSLEYVQAVLKHSFSPSKVSDLVNGLRRMQAEIRACLEELESSFGHVNDLYNIIKIPSCALRRPRQWSQHPQRLLLASNWLAGSNDAKNMEFFQSK
jgi:hypothetical protein